MKTLLTAQEHPELFSAITKLNRKVQDYFAVQSLKKTPVFPPIYISDEVDSLGVRGTLSNPEVLIHPNIMKNSSNDEIIAGIAHEYAHIFYPPAIENIKMSFGDSIARECYADVFAKDFSQEKSVNGLLKKEFENVTSRMGLLDKILFNVSMKFDWIPSLEERLKLVANPNINLEKLVGIKLDKNCDIIGDLHPNIKTVPSKTQDFPSH